MSEADQTTQRSLDELDELILELRQKVSTLRDGELDAASLEERLRELNELAIRAATALESVSR